MLRDLLCCAGAVALALIAHSSSSAQSPAKDEPLLQHLRSADDLGELRGLEAAIDRSSGSPALKVSVKEKASYTWLSVPAPAGGWPLARRSSVSAEIANAGPSPVSAMFWVVGASGWSAVGDFATLQPGESQKFVCDLRAAFPDGTPKISPAHVTQIQVMLRNAPVGSRLQLSAVAASGEAPEWICPAGRLELPTITREAPAPGRRVEFQLPGESAQAIHGLLYLPVDWQVGASFPLIVEFPGNIFLAPACYSTGRPEQCVIGYGMCRGRGAIWLSLPFIDRATGAMVENGWGNADDTADLAVRMVEEICRAFGADRRRVILTGFSRGAIACGYIGLRNERIAALWKGFHACQHYDGDGWNGADLAGAIERARRVSGLPVFHTDNLEATFQPVMEAMQAKAVYAQSGLGFHDTAMFLDDRPSTQKLRAWFAELVAPSPAPEARLLLR